MESLVTGLNFVLGKDLIKDEVFTVSPNNELNLGCLEEVTMQMALPDKV
jgi:hypothetical protein